MLATRDSIGDHLQHPCRRTHRTGDRNLARCEAPTLVDTLVDTLADTLVRRARALAGVTTRLAGHARQGSVAKQDQHGEVGQQGVAAGA